MGGRRHSTGLRQLNVWELLFVGFCHPQSQLAPCPPDQRVNMKRSDRFRADDRDAIMVPGRHWIARGGLRKDG
jgi:hypothetical protein